MAKITSTNAENKTFLLKSCRINGALNFISGRWKALIIIHISEGTNRFSLLKTELHGISDQALGKQLKEMENDRLVSKTIIPGVPVRVDYYLTPKGGALLPILEEFSRWSEIS